MATLKITQTKSTIRQSKQQKRTMEALGLRRIGQSNELDATPAIRGMVAKVEHLVSVEETA